MVEVAILCATNKCVYFIFCVYEDRSLWIARVSHGDPLAVGQVSQLDAVAARVASFALFPYQTGGELPGRYSIVYLVHVNPSDTDPSFGTSCISVFLHGCRCPPPGHHIVQSITFLHKNTVPMHNPVHTQMHVQMPGANAGYDE